MERRQFAEIAATALAGLALRVPVTYKLVANPPAPTSNAEMRMHYLDVAGRSVRFYFARVGTAKWAAGWYAFIDHQKVGSDLEIEAELTADLEDDVLLLLNRQAEIVLEELAHGG